jgi:hypothetical protein
MNGVTKVCVMWLPGIRKYRQTEWHAFAASVNTSGQMQNNPVHGLIHVPLRQCMTIHIHKAEVSSKSRQSLSWSEKFCFYRPRLSRAPWSQNPILRIWSRNRKNRDHPWFSKVSGNVFRLSIKFVRSSKLWRASICGLLHDVVSISDYTASNGMTNGEKWIRKYLQVSDTGLVEVVSPICLEELRNTTNLSHDRCQADIETEHHRNTSLVLYHCNTPAWVGDLQSIFAFSPVTAHHLWSYGDSSCACP